MTERTFFLDQHGCAKNQVDGELLINRLSKAGYVRTDDASSADLIIINTCGFIESAKKESLDALMAARAARPDAKILLAGCLAQRYADVFRTELPEADGIFGNGDLAQIEKTVSSLFSGGRPVVVPEQKGVCCGDRDFLLSFKGSAYVKITEGCNNRCTFCAIPHIRGPLRSRPASDIVDEITSLVANGVREINLIGQDLAAYGCGKDDDVLGDGTNGWSALYQNLSEPLFLSEKPARPSYLHELLSRISNVQGNFWVRLLYIHPDHFCTDILDAMERDSRLLPYFDIPFQSGSGTVVRAMNRKGGFDSYAALVDLIRSRFPQAALRTTFLAGFPGESDEDALCTEEFLSRIQADWSGCFPYSREEDTPAAGMKGRVSKRNAQLRKNRLERIQEQLTASRLSSRVGKDYDVLVEEIVENADGTDDGLAIGRAWFEAPEVDGSVVIRYDLDDKDAVSEIVPGRFVRVHVLSSSAVDLDGVYVPA